MKACGILEFGGVEEGGEGTKHHFFGIAKIYTRKSLF